MSDVAVTAAGYEDPEVKEEVNKPKGPTGGWIVDCKGNTFGPWSSANEAAEWMSYYYGYDGIIRRLKWHP